MAPSRLSCRSLNTTPNVLHQFRLLGGYSFALSDYADEGCVGFIEQPEWAAMNAHRRSDHLQQPLHHAQARHHRRRRRVLPARLAAVVLEQAAGPEAAQYHSRRRALARHRHHRRRHVGVGLLLSRALGHAAAQATRWQLFKSNGTGAGAQPARIVVDVDAASRPNLVGVQMWKANTISTKRRDFRLITCRDLSMGGCFQPVIWWPTRLHESAPGQYVATSDAPLVGWSGFLIELQFEYPDSFTGRNHTLTVTSEMNTVPDTLPYGPCTYCNCGAGCGPIPGPVGK
jgi:hypothetical protein